MQVKVNPKNIGGSAVVPAIADGRDGDGGGDGDGDGDQRTHPVRVRSIALDDLVPLLDVLGIQRAILKIDIEGFLSDRILKSLTSRCAHCIIIT